MGYEAIIDQFRPSPRPKGFENQRMRNSEAFYSGVTEPNLLITRHLIGWDPDAATEAARDLIKTSGAVAAREA